MQRRRSIKNRLIYSVCDKTLKKANDFINNHGLANSREVYEEYVLLCAALKYRNRNIAKELIERDCMLNRENRVPSNTPLHFAVINSDIEIVKLLLDRGANSNAKDKYGRTPIFNAIQYKKIEIKELLLIHDADINVRDKNNISLLEIAIEAGYLQIVDCLLKLGVHVNYVCASSRKKGYAPLHLATINGNKQIITLLLNAGANVNIRGESNITPLHIASERGNVDAVVLFLNKGADINACTKDNETPLYVATKNKRTSIVKLLLECGANVDDQDNCGRTILSLAVQKGDLLMVENILKFCPEINNKFNKNCLKTAVYGDGKNYKKIVEALLEYGFKINPPDVKNYKLLRTAIEKGYVKFVESLLKLGAVINSLHNSTFEEGYTPLHIAAINEQKEIGELLITYGADVDAKNNIRQTPLFYAIQNEDFKFVKLLLINGADPNYKPELLHIAVTNDSIEIVEALLQYSADFNASDIYGKTALHFTAFSENKGSFRLLTNEDVVIDDKAEIAKMLLSKGAKINAQTKSGLTTLHIATQKRHLKVIKALLEYDADVNISDLNGNTALHYILMNESEEFIKHLSVQNHDIDVKVEIAIMLLDKGANVNAKTKSGKTILHVAAQKADLKVIKVLFKYNVDVKICDILGKTALHYTVMNEDEILYSNVSITDDTDDDINVKAVIAKLLLSKGADADGKSYCDITPLHVATQKGYAKIVETLLEYNANVNCRVICDVTPLLLAAKNNDSEVAEILLKFGADVNSIDDSRKTPITIATENGHYKVVSALLDYGSDFKITHSSNIIFFGRDRNDIRIFNNQNFGADDIYYDDHGHSFHLNTNVYVAFQRYLIKLKAANLPVSDTNLRYILQAGMDAFHAECKEELAKMKCEMIYNSISLYDILTKDVHSVATYLKNENIVQVLKLRNYKTKFPLYFRLVNYHFRQAMIRKELLKVVNDKFFIFFKSTSKLPYDCIERIVSYLDEKDLKSLVIDKLFS